MLIKNKFYRESWRILESPNGLVFAFFNRLQVMTSLWLAGARRSTCCVKCVSWPKTNWTSLASSSIWSPFYLGTRKQSPKYFHHFQSLHHGIAVVTLTIPFQPYKFTVRFNDWNWLFRVDSMKSIWNSFSVIEQFLIWFDWGSH